MSSRRPARSLSRRYFAALVGMAGLIILDQLLIQPELARLSSDAPVINVSGRQRMLSQNLTKTALILAHETDIERVAERRRELEQLLQLWTKSQAGLRWGDPELQLPGSNPESISAAFQGVQPHFETIQHAVQQMLELTLPGRELHGPELEQPLSIILQHEPEFLSRMHEIVGMYEAETRRHVVRLERTGWSIAAAILLTMGLLHVIAIRPATRLLEREFERAEDQYQAVIESINEGLVQIDRQRQIVYCNQQFSQLVGTDPHTLLHASIEQFFSPGVLADLLQSEEAKSRQHPHRELQLQGVDGVQRICWVSPRCLQDAGDQLRGWVLVVMDISERRAAEAHAQQLADRLAHADRLKSVGEIAAGLAHEVNQPLGAIANYAEGALIRLENQHMTLAEIVNPLQRILSAALRAGSIIHGVKQYSRHRPYTLTTADINLLVQEIVELCRFEMQRHHVRCHLVCQADPPELTCDVIQIGQVLTNLIQNAIHALEHNAVESRNLWIETRLSEGDEIILEVRDDGPGIPPEILEHLFEPFSTSRQDGLGMGLSIVRSIVETHGGHVAVHSAVNSGAAFRVTLPRHGQLITSPPGGPLEVCHV